jgi:glutamine amidotransferase
VKVTILDYGAGNLASVVKAFAAIGADPTVTSSASELERSPAIIVPGVGHFRATAAIDRGRRRAIRCAVDGGAALLGICLGLQWLFEGSDEAPGMEGLGVFAGRCFDLADPARMSGTVKVPHVGWNSIDFTGQRPPLLEGVQPGATVYFSHSFAAPAAADAIATTDHGGAFTSAIARDNVSGMQFHPEKSGRIGLRILANFLVTAQRARSC